MLKLYFTILGIAQNSRFPWVWIYSFTAVVMAIAATIFLWLASESRKRAGLGRTANAPPERMAKIPPERIALLSRFEPPEYKPSAADSPQFQAVMQRYQRRDYAGAMPGLRAIVEAHPDSVAARFYMAICQLLTNDRSSAVAALKEVIGAGNTPFHEPARFYLAKALLAGGDVRGADIQLRVIVEMHGPFEKQATVLLTQILPNR